VLDWTANRSIEGLRDLAQSALDAFAEARGCAMRKPGLVDVLTKALQYQSIYGLDGLDGTGPSQYG